MDLWVRATWPSPDDPTCRAPQGTSLVDSIGRTWFKGQFPISELNHWAFGIAPDGDLWFAARPEEVYNNDLDPALGMPSPVCTDLGGGGVRDGQWHHVAVQRSLAGDVSLWVDGVRRATGTSGSGAFTSGSGANPAQFGQRRDFTVGPGNGCNGCSVEVDELRLSSVLRWDATFTPAHAAYRSDASTLALWHFDRFAERKTLDSSPHGNDLNVGTAGPGIGDGLSNRSPFTD
ncbi:LamG domain-containing protein [Aquihabitans sp. G128]|uniref:LamG domain-containing protein n=1 Tax=Aquihabitans sp. G128 TaxID=2849779 RepID=UPI001C210634|nr:LamG domain-containing protein [Aquihabitans sp. G128]QXC61078.1 LamG domain-containing protein [Aquihabitans sp. G128]